MAAFAKVIMFTLLCGTIDAAVPYSCLQSAQCSTLDESDKYQ